MGLLSFLLPAVVALAAQTPAPAPSPKPPTAPPPLALQGVVNGPDGKPVADALVFCRRRNARWGDAATSVRTDPAGTFRLPLTTRDPLVVWVQASSLALRTIEGPALNRPLTVTLAPGTALEGRVLDGATNSPIAGARVFAGLTAGDLPAVLLEPDAGRARAVTDARGRFRLTGLGPGLQTVTATARGFGRARQQNVQANSTLEMFLFPGASISGAVAGPDGKALPGALVSATRAALWYAPVTEKADALGRFEILGLEPGTYDVVAMAKGLAPGLIRGVGVRGTDDERVTLSLDEPTRVVGRVLSDPKHPVTSWVSVQEMGGEATPRVLGDLLRTEADADGRFSIDDVPPGSHVLGLQPRGFAPKRVDLDVPLHRPVLDLGDILVERGLTIAGRIRTASGQGVADAEVYAWGGRGRSRSRSTSQEDGSFVLAGLDPGGYEVSVSAPGFGPGHGMFDAGDAQADIVLEAAGSISGEVVDRALRAVVSFTVVARRLDTTTERMQEEPVSHEFSSADGRFVLEDVPPGSWVLEVTAPGHESATVSSLGVRAGTATPAGRIRLGDGGMLRGTVVNGIGEPVAGATVAATQQQDYGYQATQPPQTQSDANGAFELRGIPGGQVDVAATHPSYARAYQPGVEIDPASGPTELKLVMSQGGRIEGSVRRRDGTPIAEAQVRIWPMTTTGRIPPADGALPTAVGPDGVFAIDRVPAGMAQVSLIIGRGGPQRSTESRQVEVREGESATADFVLGEILVSGSVTRAAGPPSGIRIEMRSRSGNSYFSWGASTDFIPPPREGPERGFAITGDDGRYQLIVGAAGTTQATLETADGRVRLAAKTLEIPDVDAFTADFDLRGVPVSGVTVDQETETPVPRVAVWASPRNEGGGGSGGRSGSDVSGRFQLELEPGTYALSTSVDGYAPADTTISVGPTGLSDLRVELAQGLTIAGRVVDSRGGAVGGLEVIAATEKGGQISSAVGLPDGTFVVKSLPAGSYTVSAGSDLQGFAVLPGVTPGGSAITLALRPTGRARLNARNTEGGPVLGAFATLVESNGVPMERYLNARSDAQGVLEVSVPYGRAQLRIGTYGLVGRVTLEIKEGETANATVVLEPE
jgi:protocatechuate 3,4-dioxygenase beta subunit